MQLHSNRLWEITYDPGLGSVKIGWTEATADMADSDFKEALERFAHFAAGHRAPRLMVDVTGFRHPLTAELGQWREAEIVPLYNRAGVKRFAYVVGPDFPAPPAGEDVQAEGETFVTRFFLDEAEARAWLEAS